MTPEIRRLQVLNDLIAQTLDVINQRAFVDAASGIIPDAVFGGLGYGPGMPVGLSHSPFQVGVGFGARGLFGPFGMGQTGLQQPAFVNPLVAQMTGGLSHTPYIDPRLAAIDARVASVDPRVGTWPFAIQPRPFAGYGVYGW